MFSATKSSAGPYPLLNSRNKFVQELNTNEHKLFNRSFDSANKLLNRSPKLKQTKLCLNKSLATKNTEYCKENEIKADATTTAQHFFQMPFKTNEPMTRPQNLSKKNVILPCGTNVTQCHNIADGELKVGTAKNTSSYQLNENVRNQVIIMGKVDFCLKIHKKYPEVNAIYDVYGQLLRISIGKQRCEFILLLRNDSGGPVLQAIYYDFSNKLKLINTGSHIRVVGRFIGENRLQTFNLQRINNMLSDEHYSRIQNVTSFALIQNKN